MTEHSDQVVVTDAAVDLLREIRAEYGEVVFKISAGCCDGSGPMVYRIKDAFIGVNDILLGTADGAEIWAAPPIAKLWENAQMILDAGPGSGAGFSLDAGRKTHFLTKARILSDSR